MTARKIAVLMGGWTSERQVSLWSGEACADALDRLQELIRAAIVTQKKRKPTRQTLGAKKRRLEGKTKRGQLKSLRKKVIE